MNMNLENTRHKFSRVQLSVILSGWAMVVTSQFAQADDAPFDAYETVREAGIGTNAADYHLHDTADTSANHAASEHPVKSESIYVNGKAVCFKLESNVSVAYYCDN
jgi:hypothetical protein